MSVPVHTSPAPPPWGRVPCGARCLSPPSDGDPREGVAVFWSLRSPLLGSPGAGEGAGRGLRGSQRRCRPVSWPVSRCPGWPGVPAGVPAAPAVPVSRLVARLARPSGGCGGHSCPRARRGCPPVPSLFPGPAGASFSSPSPPARRSRPGLRGQAVASPPAAKGTGGSKHSAGGGGEPVKVTSLCTHSPASPGPQLRLSWGPCGGAGAGSARRCSPAACRDLPWRARAARAASHPPLPPPAPGRGGSWVPSHLAVRAGNAGSAVRFGSRAVAVPGPVQG